MEVIMVRADEKEKIRELGGGPNFSPAQIGSMSCLRCGGLMVFEVFTDLLESAKALECAPKRCVQCGDVVDSVILRNRLMPQEPMSDSGYRKLFAEQ
jgi:hypothetical protein